MMNNFPICKGKSLETWPISTIQIIFENATKGLSNIPIRAKHLDIKGKFVTYEPLRE